MKRILVAFLAIFLLPSSTLAFFDSIRNYPVVDQGMILGDSNINPLDQFTSTTGPAITQRTYGKAIKITGLDDGCLSLSSSILTSSGSACGSGGGGGTTFSTTSADYWKTQRNFFSTTSTDYWLTQQVLSQFSTTSADYWKTVRNFFSTTSADYWLTTKTVATANGGTGQSSYSVGDTLYASGATTLSKLTIGNSGDVLTVNGGIPVWLPPSGGSGGSWATTSEAFFWSQNRDWNVTGSPKYLAPTTTIGLLVVASSTISSLTSNFGTTTYATSTNSFATIASSTNLYSTYASTSLATVSSTLFTPFIQNAGNVVVQAQSGSAGFLTMSSGTIASWFNGTFRVDATTASTNSNNGALVVLGGAGIAGSVNIAGNASTTQLTATNSTYLATLGGNVGIASTSPWALLSVNPNGISGPAFAIGSSTNTYMVVGNNGHTTFGTTTNNAILSVYGAPSTSFTDPSTYPFSIIPNKNAVQGDYLMYIGNGPTSGLAGGLGIASNVTSGIGMFDRDGIFRFNAARGGAVISSANYSNCCSAASADVALKIVPFAHSTLGGALGENQTLIIGTSTTAGGAVGYRLAGNYANQRFTTIGQPQITATTTFGITNNAATAYIIGAPSALGSATLGTSTALLIESGTSTNAGVTTAYGLYVASPYGAVNNYTASFMGGNVGIKTARPQTALDTLGTASSTDLFVAGNSTTTNATSTNFFATTASTTNLYSASVLIGTSSQSQSSLLSIQGNIFSSGTVYANNFYDTSFGGSSCIGETNGLLNTSNCVSSIASSGGTITVSSPTGAVNIDLPSISAGVLGTPITGTPSRQATSTLYGTGIGGQVLGWSNVTGGIAWIATSSSAGGGGSQTPYTSNHDAAGFNILNGGEFIGTSTIATSTVAASSTSATGAVMTGSATCPFSINGNCYPYNISTTSSITLATTTVRFPAMNGQVNFYFHATSSSSGGERCVVLNDDTSASYTWNWKRTDENNGGSSAGSNSQCASIDNSPGNAGEVYIWGTIYDIPGDYKRGFFMMEDSDNQNGVTNFVFKKTAPITSISVVAGRTNSTVKWAVNTVLRVTGL